MSEIGSHNRLAATGDHIAVAGARVTVLLDDAARAGVGALWELVDAGAGFEAVLDALVRDGISRLGGFALVEHGPATRVLVRGDIVAVIDTTEGEISVEHDPTTVWTERTVASATGGRIHGRDWTAQTGSPMAPGVVRAGAVLFAQVAAVAEPTVVVPEPTPEPTPTPEPAPEPEPTPEPEPDTHDGQTSVGSPPDDFVRPQMGIPGQELAPPVVAHPVAKLIFSTGELIDVDRVILVGRAPEAHRFASSDQPRLVTVASPQHEISSTHLEIRPGAGADHGMAVVTDMGSTNGTVLVQPGLPPEDLQAGIAVSLIPGAILDLGDGVTIQTTNP